MSVGQWDKCNVEGIPFILRAVRVIDLSPGTPGVYAIKWADGSQYEYVGQTRCVRHRLQNHEHGFLNCTFELLNLTDMEDLADRLECEGRWITRLVLAGHDLRNDCHYAKAARKKLESAPVIAP